MVTTDTNPTSSSSLSKMINPQEIFQSSVDNKKLVTVQNDKADTKTEQESKQGNISHK